MNPFLPCTLAAGLTAFALATNPADFEPVAVTTVAVAEPAPGPLVQLAICLDTSGSMSGLIESAKQKLWAIVNDLALADPTPRLEVALITFGNDGHNPENGWTRTDIPFTDDLDLVSQGLFALSTNGGTEYVGRAIHVASALDWHPSDGVLKLIVVAGNESADQDQEMPFRDMCKSVITRGIMVNSIYCGSPTDDIAPGWAEVARLADGQFVSIDQNQGTVVVETPFDVRLSELSLALNETYIPLGATGQVAYENQVAQDVNAAGLNLQNAAQRCSTKGSAMWVKAWDLVDACQGEDFDLATVKTEDLPEVMQAMSIEERAAYVKSMSTKRATLRTEVTTLTQQRTQFVEAEMKKQGLADEKAFDRAIRDALRRQAGTKGYRFPEPVPAPAEAKTDQKDDGC